MSHFRAAYLNLRVRQIVWSGSSTPIRCARFSLLGLVLLLAACSAVAPWRPIDPTAQPATISATPLPSATWTPLPTFTPPPTATPVPIDGLEVHSPNGRVQAFLCVDDGLAFYRVRYDGREVILPSMLGLVFRNAEPLNHDLYVDSVERRTVDETWTQPWGEVKTVRNHYNELRTVLKEAVGAGRHMAIVFRVYDDGLGFRYELPQQPNLGSFELIDEETEFVLTGNHVAWWIPAYGPDCYEYLYLKSAFSTWEWSSVRAVHTPLTMQTADGLYLSIHEAALIDYAAMTLALTHQNTLKCDLVPWSDGVKVRGTTPHQSPWRTIQIAERPGDLITSRLILNLNEPNRLPDVSWIHPGKYVGIWWEMHIGKSTWNAGPLHGATTQNARRYIALAAEQGFSRVLVEGWNVGWDGNWMEYGERFRFTTAYPDYDLSAVAAYAAEKGVGLIAHNETAGAVQNYERQMADAFALYRRLGIDTIKTGYVSWGQGIPRWDAAGRLVQEWHHGQYMVRHYQKVVETAAAYGLMLIVHEPIKPTGLQRTYPNLLSQEGARGQEYNAWSDDGGNPPEHTVILPFTRLLAGPLDYTPGIVAPFDRYRPGHRTNVTLAKELALYVVLYSPLQMAADLAENYQGHPALPFIARVPADWNDTRVLHAAIGEYATIVRQERDGREWYLGSITDRNGRTLETQLDFLEPGVSYVAEIYADGPDAHWQGNSTSLDVRRALVDRETVLVLRLAPGGGQAIRFFPASELERLQVPPYRP